MNEKRFSETERAYYYTTLVFDNQTQEELGTDKVVVLLNELNDEQVMYKTTIDKRIVELKEENKKLQKQIQNYEKLIANSYVGEEERLDGWVGQYVIWEDELQEYKNKKSANKKVV